MFCHFHREPISFLCMRRDVSEYYRDENLCDEFSLHAQRCFLGVTDTRTGIEVFSARAEMFPTQETMYTQLSSFLCMRRDVSGIKPISKQKQPFSLHAQRCFYGQLTPTLRGGSFLCMRRDVSHFYIARDWSSQFSLHAQRCFRIERISSIFYCVFSACAETFSYKK